MTTKYCFWSDYCPSCGLSPTRRLIDEQAVWTLMRFADEPAERAPSRQLTRADSDEHGRSARLEAGEFDRAIERLNDADESPVVDAFHTGQPVWVIEPDGSQRPGSISGRARSPRRCPDHRKL